MDLLACSYLNGIEIDENVLLAEKWLKRAVAGGCVHSMTHLGQLYYEERSDSSKKKEGLQLIRQAAESGDARGQLCWANIVLNGEKGVIQNTDEYLLWVRKAANQGLADAQYSLAFELRAGRFLQANPVDARIWAGKAAQQNMPDACFLLAEMLLTEEGGDKDSARHAALVRKAAKSGVAGAEYAMASFYSQGLFGFPVDANESLRWIRLASEHGDVNAQQYLASYYLTGENRPKNIPEAVRWFRSAARQGHPQAQNSIGYACEIGDAGYTDLIEAYMWYQLAAKQGEPVAQVNLKRLLPCLTSKEIAEGNRRMQEFPKQEAPQ